MMRCARGAKFAIIDCLAVVQNMNASRFIEDNWHNSSLDGIDANAALTQFAGWLVEQHGLLPDHDQATLFTRLALHL